MSCRSPASVIRTIRTEAGTWIYWWSNGILMACGVKPHILINEAAALDRLSMRSVGRTLVLATIE